MHRLCLFLIPLFALVLLAGCNKQPTTTTTNNQESSMAASAAYTGKLLSGKHIVVLHTSKGGVTIELDADAAPKTVTNFVKRAQEGYYDDLTFHRVIPDFMVQGGDPNGNGTGGESIFGEKFEDEINADSYGLDEKMLKDEVEDEALPEQLKEATVKEYYKMLGYRYDDSLESLPMARGALAMANSGPNTNGSQFFIIQREEGTPWLEGKHTVFGTVTEGMDVIDVIVAVERGTNDKPVEDVTFTVEVVGE